MVKNITEATTSDEIIEIIHPVLIQKIPKEDLKTIADNILLVERYFRGEVWLSPLDVSATRIYSLTTNQITQIEFAEITYKL